MANEMENAVLSYCHKAGPGIVMRKLAHGVCAVVDVNYFRPQVIAAGLDWFVVRESLPTLPEAKPEPKINNRRASYYYKRGYRR